LPRIVLYLALGIIPIFWIARKIANGRWSAPTPLDVPLAILLGLGLIGVAVSNDSALSTRLYLELVGGIAVYYGVLNGISTQRLSVGIWTILILGAGLGVIGLLGLHFSNKFLPVLIYPYIPKLDLAFLNPRGFTANIVAGAIAPVVPLGFALALTERGVRRIIALALAVGLLGIVLVSQSRGALFGLALGLGILLVWRVPRLLWFVLVAAALLVAAIVFWGPGTLGGALLVSDSTGSAGERVELWDRAVHMMRDFPFTGIGIGTFEPVVQTLYPLFSSNPGTPQPHAHNLYLQMGVDLGIGGLAAFLGLVVTAIATGILNIRRAGDKACRAIAAGLLAGYVTYLMHGLLDAVALSTKVSIIVWLILALMMAVAVKPVQEL
jgi:putative inorganic carbon (HCO3(-)) transporter